MPAPHRLTPLLHPNTVALVGASARQGSVGEWTLNTFLKGAFKGELFLVNPSYDEVQGMRCYNDLADLPCVPDMVILNVGSARIEALFDHAVALGIRAFTIFDYCMLEEDTEPNLLARLRTKAKQHEVTIVGGGGMGFYNFDGHVHATYYEADHLVPGHISLIAHSGSVFTVLAMCDPRHRFNLIISAGSEISTTSGDFLSYAISLDSTRVVAMFLETVRDPQALIEALQQAQEKDIPVVICKVGKSEKSQGFALTHTGAMVGNQAAYDALFDRYGVLQANSLDEMMATAALMAQGRRAGPGGIGAILDSGGLRQLLADLIDKHGLPFATFSPKTVAAIENALPHTLKADNPLDAAGPFSYDYVEVFGQCLTAIVAEPDSAITWFEFDATDSFSPIPEYSELAKEAANQNDKPFIVVNSSSATMNTAIAVDLLDHGIALINGVDSAIVAVKNLFNYRDYRARGKPIINNAADTKVISSWTQRLRDNTILSEVEALKLLNDYGVPTIECAACNTLDEVMDFTEEVGYPVAIKTAVGGVNHKSDVGGVHLNLTDRSQLYSAYEQLQQSLGTSVTVASMAAEGIELAFGMLNDDQFGPLVVVSAGGTMIEYLNDRVTMLAPVDHSEAQRALEKLTVYPMLKGIRGAQPSNIESVVNALVRFSHLAYDLRIDIGEIDVNPLIASAEAAVAVDALVITKSHR